MIWALTNDVIQRLVTFNKRHQRRNLSNLLERFHLGRGLRVLDFGCGTALFAPVFTRHGLAYHGYDIDPRLLRYAARLYPNGVFLSHADELRKAAPFDLVVANCCFHHIDDDPLAVVVRQIHDLLTEDGMFILIDLAAPEGRTSWLKRVVFAFDQGVKVRTRAAYQRVLESHFHILATELVPQPLGPFARHPLFLDLAVLVSRKATEANRS